jgi:ribosomal protein L10
MLQKLSSYANVSIVRITGMLLLGMQHLRDPLRGYSS